MEIAGKPSDYDLKLKQPNVSNHETFIERELNNAIQNIAKNEGYTSYKAKKEIISTGGGNYLGLLYVVDIIGKTADGDKETNIFIKTIVPENENFNILSVSDAYNNELFMYKELSDLIKELEDEAEIPMFERFKMVKSYNESNTKMIILENMTKKGFSTFHRMDVISLKFAELAVKELAKFHGIFYVLQHKRKEYFNRKLRTLRQPFNLNGKWNEFITNLCEMSCQLLEGDMKRKIDKFIPLFLEKFPQYMEDMESIGCTICHGDYRANNILMKSENGEVTEVVPVDYQLLYYGCPIYDFFYLIFTGTDQEFRKAHMENLKNLYYQSVGDYLKYFDMEIEMVFPRKEFNRLYKERLDYGLMMSLFVTPFCFASEDDVPDISKDEMSTASFKLDKKFEKRIMGVVDDFVNWGYL